MINKEELLEQLRQYDYYVINKLVDLTSQSRRGIYQTSIYHNVEPHWNGSVFKFWHNKDEDNNLYLDANIDKAEFNKDVLTIHIVDCPEVVEIRCCKHSH